MEETQKVTIKADAEKYVKTKVEVDGKVKTRRDINDETAEMLRPLTLDEVYAKAAEVKGCDVNELKAQHEGKNAGMRRMVLGNMIRAALRKAA
jgi:hypothetical protein